ncbi:sensor domain-containing diguanylate cyclase [Ancylobacter pratisalsi]|uniref:diguanylate cyclase n=1 Tax=Ancylobacter pratisalsi TaxID=1745854 RepID=A0A6P1YMV1_9HYPH|nr:diguanylate cyclase [Ancylobacter pratisalsi]QIB34041.1 diguanylate cyclase [Ancylobacter pratisalsi]
MKRHAQVRQGARTVSLRVRLGVLAAIVMTLVIAERTYSIVRLERDNVAAAERHVFELTERGVGHYENGLTAVRTMLVTLASDTRMTTEDAFSIPRDANVPASTPDPGLTPAAPELCDRLHHVLEVTPVAASLAVIAGNGIVRCGTAPNAAGLDVSNRDHFKIAMRGIPTIETVSRSLVTGAPSIYADHPLVGPSGRIIGVLVARVDIEELFPRGLVDELGLGAEMMIIDPSGAVMINYPDDPALIGQNLHQEDFVARAMSRTSGTVTANGTDGVRRIYAFSRLPGGNMHLIVGVDERTILAPIERATFQAGLTLLLASLLIVIGLWIAGERLIVTPVKTLADRLVRFGRGEDVQSDRSPALVVEMQPLAIAFESMAEELMRRESALRSANRRLSSLASLDPLTGIANRRSFDAVAALQWGTAPQLALAILDIDHFKRFNDRYGHQEGDHCLQSLAQALAATVRGTDIVARIGGEEFAVLMPGAPLGAAADVAERLRKAVERAAIAHSGAPEGIVTVSIGCASCRPSPQLTLSDLFVAADRALYAAKHAGRNTVRCTVNVQPQDETTPIIAAPEEIRKQGQG